MAKVTEEATYTLELSKDEVNGLYALVAFGVTSASIKELGLTDLYKGLRNVLGDTSRFENWATYARLK